MLLSRTAVVILPLLLSPFSPIASAQEDAVATCPPNTVSEGALTLPNGDACKLCVPSMDDCKASCSCPTADTCECTPDPPGCGTLVCPGDEPPPTEEGCNACEDPDMPGTFYCVGDTFLVDEGSDNCASCTCDDADGAIGCVSCYPPSVEMPPDEDCDACEDPDMPGTFYCVGDTFLVDEGSDNCASCTCDDADGAIGCVSCYPPSVEMPPDEDCDACEDPDMPGTFYCVGDTFLVDEGSDNCASCTCDDADGAIGCVSCYPPSVEMPEDDETKQEDTVSTSEECSVTVDVGCVLMDNEAMDCNEYVPTSPENCNKQVKFTLQIDQLAPPLNIMLESIYRYRETSAFGNPRSYSEDKWGTNLTPFEMQYYKLNTWEGEYVNFCIPTSIETTLEYKTSCATTSDTYVLETTDVFPEQTLPMSAEEPIPEDGEVNVDYLVGEDTTSDAAASSIASSLLASAGALVVMMFW